MDFASTIITSVLSSGVLIWASKEWLSTKLRASIQHEYDIKLETIKSDLSRQATFHYTAYTSFAEGQKAAMERKLQAVDKLWLGLLEFRSKLPYVLWFVDILTVDEYKGASSHKRFIELTDILTEEEIINVHNWNIEEIRPYIGEYAWSLIYIYRAIFLRISILLLRGRADAEKMEWHKDNGIQQLLDAVLLEAEKDTFDKQRLGKISWIQRQLESKILIVLHKIISGEEFVAPSIEQLHKIQNAIIKFQHTKG